MLQNKITKHNTSKCVRITMFKATTSNNLCLDLLAPTSFLAMSFHAMDVCITGINHCIIIQFFHTMCKIKHLNAVHARFKQKI